MKDSLPPVVVITGASSGVGRGAALAFSRNPVRLVLCARDTAGLESIAAECRQNGAQCLIMALDVADSAAVEELRARAVAEFGCIDVWVNSAAVLLLGRFEDVPAEDFRRVIDTNLFGYVNGSRAALRQFRLQGARGTLINVASVLGVITEPMVSPYVASKFAIRGLTGCLRQEMRDCPHIRICTVLPWALDTPIYQHAANFAGRAARSIAPVYDVERAARKIVRLAARPRREVAVGMLATLALFGTRLWPSLVERMVGRIGPSLQFENRPAARSKGNLMAPTGPHAASGGWRAYWLKARAKGTNLISAYFEGSDSRPLEVSMDRNPESTARIGTHPIHPMLIPFPIVFFISTLLTDIAFWRTGNPGWATASLWLLGAGILGAAAAAVAGLIDFAGDTRIRALNDAWKHAIGNVVAVVLAIVSWFWRYTHDVSAVVPVGLTLSVIVALILLYTGWLGGELVYRHRVAVDDGPVVR